MENSLVYILRMFIRKIEMDLENDVNEVLKLERVIS